MPELLSAADVLIHSTGGMTSLEAATAGGPQIAFGADLGHIRIHNAALCRLGLVRQAGDRAELQTVLRCELRAARRAPALGRDGAAPGEIVRNTVARAQPTPVWRVLGARAAGVLAAATVAIAGVTSDEAYSLESRPLRLHAITHLSVREPAVALIVRADGRQTPELARTLAAAGAHASFAMRTAPSRSLEGAIRADGDETVPELGGTPPKA